jgi:hypothetical protein
VTLAPELLAEAFAGLALRPIRGSAPTRDVYVLLPPGGQHPLVGAALDALGTAAAQLTHHSAARARSAAPVSSDGVQGR